MTRTRVLITGAAGFIGSHVVAHILRNTDWNIIALDGLTYASDVDRLLNDETWIGYRGRVSLRYHDLRAPIPDRMMLQWGAVDFVLNLASESHVDRSISEPVSFVMNNVGIALNMLEMARVVKPKLFVQISTDEVFGPAPDGYAFKEWDVHTPSNPYAASKSCQEQIAVSYWRTFDVPLVITNTMNNFGERQDCEKLVPKCINACLTGQPITIHGEWNSMTATWRAGSRVWLHARNFADGLLYILKTLNHPLMYPMNARPLRFNIAGDAERTNLEIAALVAKILDKELKVEWVDHHSSRPGHDRRYALDGRKIREWGWTPPLSFEDSFRRTVLWERDHYAQHR